MLHLLPLLARLRLLLLLLLVLFNSNVFICGLTTTMDGILNNESSITNIFIDNFPIKLSWRFILQLANC